MMYRMFLAAMAAGVLAAVLISGLQTVTTTPMILKAETFEGHSSALTSHTQAQHDAWKPKEGMQRVFVTLIANAATGTAFALFLVVGLTFGTRQADLTKGLLLAGAGFAAFTLAPALGLPPELPGIPAADLTLRQLWWAATVASTLGGLACFAYIKPARFKSLGLALLAAPHIWGAPRLIPEGESLIPAALSAHFSASTMTVNAVFWALIGLFSVLFYTRFSTQE